jgi:glycosyltransferase involved in cell wall biosynthesis
VRIRYLLLSAYERGGTIRTTLSMASTLAERGHDVEVATLTQRRAHLQFPVSPRLRVVSLTGRPPTRSSPGGLGNAVRFGSRVAMHRSRTRLLPALDGRSRRLTRAHDFWLRRYLADQDDSVVVATRWGLNVALATLRTERQVAVGQEHNHLSANPAIRDLYAAHYPSLDALTVLTEGDAAAYRDLLPSGPRVVVLPNALPLGVDPPRSPLQEPVVMAAGSLVRRKGFDLLLDAWAQVAPRHPAWRLRIFGDGELADELSGRVRAAGMAGSVTLEGFEPDLTVRFGEASVFALSSRGEGMPMVLIEAMAAGLAIVAFDCPTGPAELLDGGRAGLLVPPEDPAALAEALSGVLGDPARLRRLGEAAADRARAFDREATADQAERLFAELAEARGLSVGGAR